MWLFGLDQVQDLSSEKLPEKKKWWELIKPIIEGKDVKELRGQDSGRNIYFDIELPDYP